MPDFRQATPDVGFSSSGSPTPGGNPVGVALDAVGKGVSAFVSFKRKRDAQEQEQTLGGLQRDILNIEGEKVFDQEDVKQANLNSEATDAGLQQDPEDPSMDKTGIRDLNTVATKVKNLEIASSQGKSLGAKDKALKLVIDLANDRPDLAVDAVKIFKNNFGGTPTQLRQAEERAEIQAVQAEQARRERVARDVLGGEYQEGSDVNDNYNEAVSRDVQRAQVARQDQQIKQLNRNADLSSAQRRANQLEYAATLDQNRGTTADIQRRTMESLFDQMGVKAGEDLTQDQAVQMISLLDETILQHEQNIGSNIDSLPDAQRKALIAAETLPLTLMRDRLNGSRNAGNAMAMAEAAGKIFLGKTLLSNEELSRAFAFGQNKHDPVTWNNLLKSSFQSANSNKDKAVISMTNPQNALEVTLGRALAGNASFEQLVNSSEEAGVDGAGMILGTAEFMSDNLNSLIMFKDQATASEIAQGAKDFVSIYTSMEQDKVVALSRGETPKAQLKHKEAALKVFANLNSEQASILNDNLSDQEKQDLINVTQSYAQELTKATADLVAEGLGSVVSDSGLVAQEPTSMLSRIGIALAGAVGLREAGQEPVGVRAGEIINFRPVEGGTVEFFIEDQAFSNNRPVQELVAQLNGPVRDRFNLLKKTVLVGQGVGIDQLLQSKPFASELGEEGFAATEGGLARSVSGKLREQLLDRAETLRLTEERLTKRIENPGRGTDVALTKDELSSVQEELAGINQRLGLKDKEVGIELGSSTEAEQIKIDEGEVRNEAGNHISYEDSEGFLTGGHGHLMTKAEQKKYPKGTEIPQDVVDEWFEVDMKEAETDADNYLKGLTVSKEIRDIITNMAFNLGAKKLGEFRDLKKALKEEDIDAVKSEMADSDWFKQVGKRAERLVARIK
jgi:GH24 family phage-related lysozyme (muramidase)